LSCFGDIAMAIGAQFEQFLPTVMSVLQQAGAMRADPVRRRQDEHVFRSTLLSAQQSSYELIEYINTLREGILEAYTGVISGLKAGGKGELSLPLCMRRHED
jgi:importin subunit beta-1